MTTDVTRPSPLSAVSAQDGALLDEPSTSSHSLLNLPTRSSPADRLKIVTAFKAAKRRKLDDAAAEDLAFRRYEEREDEEEEEEPEGDVAPASPAQREAAGRALPAPRSGFRLSGATISFFLMVVLPVVATAVYLFVFAAPQYISEFHFSVRMQEQAPMNAASANGGVAGSGSSATLTLMADNYIIIDFLKSRDALEALLKDVDFDGIYDTPKADWLTRLDRSQSIEKKLAYYQWRLGTSFDMTTGIATVQVRAFSPENAQQIAQALVASSERLINDMQDRARKDAIRFFEQQVGQAESRLKQARDAVRLYRNQQQISTPASSGDALLANIAKLEQDLASMRTDMTTLGRFVKPEAPSAVILASRIQSTEAQIASLRAQVGSTDGQDGSRLSGITATFEELQQNQAFAQKLYESAVTSLETARANAAMQHTYMAMFVQPRAPSTPGYPLRLQTLIVMTLGALFFWFVCLMTGYAIRDHSI